MGDVRRFTRVNGPSEAHGYLDQEVDAGRAGGVIVATVDPTDSRLVRSITFGDVTQGDLARLAAYLLAEVAGALETGR